MSTLREYNHGTVATEDSLYDGAITFTPSQDYNIDSCKLKLYRIGTPGTLTVYIYATSAGVPSGSPLTSGTYNGNSLSDSFATPSDVNISVTPYLLSGGTEYAIVGDVSGGYPNDVRWLQSSDEDYTDGVSYYYSSGWNISPYDFIFETYGDLYAPTVTTQAVSSILSTTATGRGNVTSDGGDTVTERGVCWSTSSTPTTAGSKATASGTTGSFTASMTGLSPSTLYYVRAYAINSIGTSYGNQVTFTTATQAIGFGEYIGAGSGTTKLLLHLNGNSTDSSGNGNNGTDTNITYSLANGKFGQGAGFNGISSRINYTKSSNNYLTNDFTISAWAKLISSTGANTIYQMGNCGLYFGGCHYYYPWVDVDLTDPEIPSAPSGWHLYTWTKSSTAGNVLYRDGNPVATNADTTASSNSYTNVNVGRFDFPGNNWFNGCIDDLILESRAWTASEVKKYYTNSLGRF